MKSYLSRMSAYYKIAPPKEQDEVAAKCRQNMIDGQTIILVADGGIGKTLAYLTESLQHAKACNRPVLIVSSTITNRDQIVKEYEKVMKFDATIKNGVGEIPLVLYRSTRDYVSVDRFNAIRERLEQTDISASVRRELDRIQEALDAGHALIDAVMPNDITSDDSEESYVIMSRDEITMRSDEKSDDLIADRKALSEAMEEASVIVATMTMLARSRLLRHAVRTGEIAVVVIDECDRLTSLDYAMRVALSMRELARVIAQLDDMDFDVTDAKLWFSQLTKDVARLKLKDHVMLTRYNIGGELCDAILSRQEGSVANLSRKLAILADEFEDRGFTGHDVRDAVEYRKTELLLDQVIGSMQTLVDSYLPHGERQLEQEDTDFRMFAHNDDDDIELTGISATPGRIFTWLFYSDVPVVLTTAFLGTSMETFAAQIGLRRGNIHALSGEIRAENYGSMHYVYYRNLHPAIAKKDVSPDHFEDVRKIILSEYDDGERMLVLTPGYRDIKAIVDKLGQSSPAGFGGLNIPFYVHERGTNINRLVEAFTASPGILLTVYWEGFNIVSERRNDGRRGLVDKVAITRLPFGRPNKMLETLLAHKYGDGADGWLFKGDLDEVTRRLYQGTMRGLRGPVDRCVSIFCDDRIPPPQVVIDDDPMMRPVVRRTGRTRRSYASIINAIPARFRYDLANFEVKELDDG